MQAADALVSLVPLDRQIADRDRQRRACPHDSLGRRRIERLVAVERVKRRRRHSENCSGANNSAQAAATPCGSNHHPMAL
jgi:hypothetical protein